MEAGSVAQSPWPGLLIYSLSVHAWPPRFQLSPQSGMRSGQIHKACCSYVYFLITFNVCLWVCARVLVHEFVGWGCMHVSVQRLEKDTGHLPHSLSNLRWLCH